MTARRDLIEREAERTAAPLTQTWRCSSAVLLRLATPPPVTE